MYILTCTTPLKLRGYKYTSEDMFIDNKNDPELIIPKFEFSTEIRDGMVGWIYRFSQSPYFAPYNYSIAFLAIELLDTIMISAPRFPSEFEIDIIVGACMYISRHEFIKTVTIFYFEFLVENSGNDNEKLFAVAYNILERFNYNISTRYSVMWFVDWLRGYDTHEYELVNREVLKVYMTGEYRTKDPYSVACDVLLRI